MKNAPENCTSDPVSLLRISKRTGTRVIQYLKTVAFTIHKRLLRCQPLGRQIRLLGTNVSLIVLATLFGSTVLTSCTADDLPEECVNYFNSREQQDLSVFEGFDLEKQFIIHRCGLDRHPPTDFSYLMARKRNIIPFLNEKLKSSSTLNQYEKDKSIYAITLVFEGLYNSDRLNANDPSLVVLDAYVRRITTPRLKKGASNVLSKIKSAE